jgi:hypothetical protein
MLRPPADSNKFPRTFTQLLTEIGLPPLSRYKLTHWQLRDVYEFARWLYLKRLKEVHPDRGSKHHVDCARLNRCWERLVYIFKLRGIDASLKC